MRPEAKHADMLFSTDRNWNLKLPWPLNVPKSQQRFQNHAPVHCAELHVLEPATSSWGGISHDDPQ